MELVNMERPKPEVSRSETKVAEPYNDSYYEKYPWGLRITLNDEELKKLGLNITKFDVDTIINISAKALVTSVSSDKTLNEGGESKTRNRLEFQITDLAIDNSEDFQEAFKEAADE